MIFWFTSRGIFDKNCDKEGKSWSKYIEWSKLNHLHELVSLDRMLNEMLVEPDYDNADDWNYIVVDGKYQTGFFNSLDYVIKRTTKDVFNLLAVVKEPSEDCGVVQLNDFEFAGYDLLDKEYGTSPLTNCGGLTESFLPGDLNNLGLIDNYEKAFEIRKKLATNNPNVNHADSYVIAVWRHKKIGH